MTTKNYDTFLETYIQCRIEMFNRDKSQHGIYGYDGNPTLARRMVDGLMNQTASKDGPAIRMTCRKLGIRHTYKAIQAFLAE